MSKELAEKIRAEVAAQKVERTISDEEEARRLEMAEALFELIKDQDLLDLILRRDLLARCEVEVSLCRGGRDDVEAMDYGEELVLTVVRQSGREHRGVISARQVLPNASFLFNGIDKIPSDKKEIVKRRATVAFGREYTSIEAREWLSGGNYEVYLERCIGTPAELVKTHGSRLTKILARLLGKVERKQARIGNGES